ncbi:MAG: hypothetical protein M0D55_07540 [Elusimicrobiota bacterium]|nr:MAG: hypothetical protein M0D55_07540 [Elusimicrobiota bacterium]
MTSAFQNDSIRRFHDLHIDDIDPAWSEKQKWIVNGLSALEMACRMRDREKIPADVALVFSLKTARDPVGVNFRDRIGLTGEFDHSPPALYLLERGAKPWDFGAEAASVHPLESSNKILDPGPLELGALGACYFMEFRPADAVDFSRTVVLVR